MRISDWSSDVCSSDLTLATYYRLVMHHMLPAHVQRIFYLDSDIVLRKCLSEIYDIDLDGYLFAGVEDSLSLHYNRKFGLPETAAHINAGVTLVTIGRASCRERVCKYG